MTSHSCSSSSIPLLKALMAFKQLLTEARPSMSPSFLVPTIFLLLLLYTLLRKNLRKGVNLPPGPSKLPVIGNLHQLGDSPHLTLKRFSKNFGPIFYLQLGHVPTVVVSTARLAKEVMVTHDLALASRPQIYAAKYFFYNCTDVGFAPYSAYWRHVRKICILELLSNKRVQSYSSTRQEEVENLIQQVAGSYPGTTNLSKILLKYANDVLCRTAYGRDYSNGGEGDRHGFQKMLEEFRILMGGFSLGDYFPSMEWIHTMTGMKSRIINTFQLFDNFFNVIIEEHLNPERIKDDHKDLVDVLLDLQKSETLDMPLTMENIKAIIMDMFVGGTDTTFATLDWGMTELLMNQKAMEKAQTEIRNLMGERTRVLESDLPQLEYLKATLKEIFRLHPPGPLLLPRESMEDVVIDGYDIPARTRIVVNAWTIGRDPQSWVNPEQFEPERFMGSTIDYKGHDFQLIPFGAGRRMCPAITFGIAGVELALAQLLHSFDWQLPPGVEAKDLDLHEVFGMTMHKEANLVVTAKPHFKNII